MTANGSPEGALHLYNTLTKKEEVFTPLSGNEVKMYTCGPTVYGRPHIGNYSSFLMADLLRRWLEVKGYDVKHVKNITDVGHLVADADAGEDKIQKQAEKEKTDPLAIAKRYTEQYLEDEKALNLEEPFARPRATETIPEMIAIIQELLKKGHAYETGDGIYFAVSTFPAYGKLSGNTLENLESGSRVAVNEEKKHPADFALWKKCVSDNAHHLLRWKFPSGEWSESRGEDPSSGFPGWHIECSAMSRKILGEQIDIHTGGEDNIFPHHESEIAQSECSSGKKPFSRYWLHKRRIDMGEEKMSKSLGNVLTLPDIVSQGFDPLDLRYLFLSVHYRTRLKFTEKGLEDAHKARRSILEWMDEPWSKRLFAGDERSLKSSEELVGEIELFVKRFEDAMNADLNTPAALASVFECMSWSRNQNSWSTDATKKLDMFHQVIRKTFGCFELAEAKIPVDILHLAQQRDDARAAKNFAESDRLRDELQKMGYEVRDSKEGTKVKKR